MTTPTDDSTEIRRWAFRMTPQCERTDDGWRASYPGADWSVTAPSEEEVRQKFAEEVARRRNAGEQPKGFEEAVYREHLRKPIPGVYAMDSDLYRYLVREVIGYDYHPDSVRVATDRAAAASVKNATFEVADAVS